MDQPQTSSRRYRALSAVVAACVAGYALWWAWWLAHGCLAPSLLRAAIKLPCPTTGLTRSVQSALAGDFYRAWLYNPLAGPILALLAVTLISLALRQARGEPLRLPRIYGYLWMTLLLAAWLVKFRMPVWTW